MDVALCLSGGGYRAAGFHLGTLSLLDRHGLLDSVRVLSTVSGGTITGARWVLGRARGEAFANTYEAMRSFLLETNVVDEAVARMETRPGPPSLIACAADVYDGRLFAGARFGELMDGLPVEEISLNAIELADGRAFRFQASGSGGVIGNGRVQVAAEHAREIRLADIVGASSCFPGAFEPIVFPADFDLPPATRAALQMELPLMDGGIFDNQGIDAAVLADVRLSREGRRPELFLISDTHLAPGRILAPQGPRTGGPSLGELFTAAKVLCGLSGVAGVVLLAQAIAGDGLVTRLASLFGAVALLGLGAGLPLAWRALVRKVGARAPEAGRTLLKLLEDLRLRDALRMGEARALSTFALLTDVFMKRVRDLSYKSLFRGARAERVVQVGIGSLLGDRLPAGSPARGVIEAANAVSTVLWLEEGEKELDVLVAAGQLTACAQLVEKLRARVARGGAAAGTDALLAGLERDLETLAGDPFALLHGGAPAAPGRAA